MIHLDAIFENGVFRPEGPLDLANHTRVHLIVQSSSGSPVQGSEQAIEESNGDIVDRQRRAMAELRAELAALPENGAVEGSPPWMRYAGLIETGDPNSSQRIDEIIDGEQP